MTQADNVIKIEQAVESSGNHEVCTQGLSPLLAQALHSRSDRLTTFNKAVLSELQEAVLNAINPIADRLGITVDRVALKNEGNLADLQIEMSIVDAIGLDRHARTLLEHGDKAGVPAGWFGKHLKLRDPLDTRQPSDGLLDVFITGLVEVREDEWRVRLYAPDRRTPMFASPRMLKRLVSKYSA